MRTFVATAEKALAALDPEGRELLETFLGGVSTASIEAAARFVAVALLKGRVSPFLALEMSEIASRWETASAAERLVFLEVLDQLDPRARPTI